jgi:hypothetical protein
MKSIKQQYIDLREGNMTQANFMRNLRMTLPQYVTNVTSFEDSVRILKNKGILTEADEKGKWTNTSGKAMYDTFKEIDNLNGQEVLIGIDYEMIKNPELTKEEAAKIVVKNLKKNSIYYTAEDMSGVEGYEPEYMSKSSKPEDWQMKPLEKNMSNIVDKKMGMQPVKGIEKPKKDSDKGGETNKMEKGVSLMSLIAKTTRGVKKMDATGEKMKKITMKEGQYDFIGHLKAGEEKELRNKIPDVHIEEDTEDQKISTIISSETKNDKEIKSIVDKIIGMPGSKTDVPGTVFNRNANITTGLNKLREVIREIISEIEETFDGMEPMDRTGLDNQY